MVGWKALPKSETVKLVDKFLSTEADIEAIAPVDGLYEKPAFMNAIAVSPTPDGAIAVMLRAVPVFPQVAHWPNVSEASEAYASNSV